MEHIALKVAPGSTDNLFIKISPLITAVLFNDNKSLTSNFPENVPSISALEHSTLPFIIPSTPIIMRPDVFMVPSTVPSIL